MPDSGAFRPLGLPPVLPEPRSAYLHIPFCHRRCFYCDFPVVPLGDRAGAAPGQPGANTIAGYLEQLEAEIRASAGGPPLSTVYFGGGTPSLLDPAQVRRLLMALRQRFGIAPGAEITLELDPASFDRDRLAAYLAAGVTRVSLGGQSFDDAVLESLGRRHRRADLLEATGWLAEARRGGRLTSWSLDLIQAVPGQGQAEWQAQLEQAVALEPPHLSVYDLTIEPGTVFARRLEQGSLALPDADLAADLMELTQAELSRWGYGHYEISNYALPGHASRHNRVYWSGAGWWGFGMGATAAPWGVREARPRTRDAYRAWLADHLAASTAEGPAAAGSHSDPATMPLDERLMVGLRRREGVHLPRLLAQQGLGPAEVERMLMELEEVLESFRCDGLLQVEGPRWRLSDPAGLALSNAVLRPLLAWWDDAAPQSSTAVPAPPVGALATAAD
jgi:putative oxygen-independent coproporphyrinogen III oxidase